MKEIIKWLRSVEHLASEVYLLAASFYDDDPKFKKFLEHTAEDEAWHYHVMGSAAEFIASEPEIIPPIAVDGNTRDRVYNYFFDIKKGVENKTISKAELIEKIVEAELSEWNDIFIYVVNSLKEKSSEFKYPAARIQAHIREIVYYLEKIENRPQALQKIKQLPPLWIENILIVDDEPMITDLIKALLNRSGNIDLAHNGSEALKQIEKKFYKLIISDIDMPIMDGLTFFQEAVAQFPTLSNRFIFMTGDPSPERERFFNENRLSFLAKPMDIQELREEAARILLLK